MVELSSDRAWPRTSGASDVWMLIRKMFRIRVVIGSSEAVLAAKRECAMRGWPWQEPVVIQEGLVEYRIMTNASSRGGNVNIAVDCRDGRIRFAALARY